MVQEQGGLCALCSEPGSADGLVVDADDLRKKIRGLVHRKMQDLILLSARTTHSDSKGQSPIWSKKGRPQRCRSLPQITPFQNPPKSKDCNRL
jgi:hypothetical protein